MKPQMVLPEPWCDGLPKVFVLAGDEVATEHTLRSFVAEAESRGARSWFVAADFASGGPWAGIRDLFEPIVEQTRVERPLLVERHDYELIHVVPMLRHSLAIRNASLTDVADSSERVRNFPADRAVRMVHGLIDFLDAWKGDAAEPWLIACHRFHAASHLGRLFFAELMRRRGGRLRLTLLLGVEPGAAASAVSRFPGVRCTVFPLAASPAVGLTSPGAEPADRTRQLETEAAADFFALQAHLPEILHRWSLAGDSAKTLHWVARALWLYPILGLYEDALSYSEQLRGLLDLHAPDDEDLLWLFFFKTFVCLVAVGRSDEARELAGSIEALSDRLSPDRKAQLFYLIAMLHVRFLSEKDLEAGESYLDQGLGELARANLPREILAFETVFNRNGLALIRNFQQRHDEAIDLCRAGFADLERELHPEKHRLHRSVLLYNIAQVYTAMGSLDQAMEFLGRAMEMDPKYSEYYNDRGNLLFRLGRLDEALADYRAAAELSPPYHEVQVNLGQCYRQMDRPAEAIRAYSTALDLQPDIVLALIGRAQSFESVGDLESAVRDYGDVLRLNNSQWEALQNRAVLLFELGRVTESLDDLERAVVLAPGEPDLYLNRATALTHLFRYAEASRDLLTFLKLNPQAAERSEVESRLAWLAGRSAAARDGRSARGGPLLKER